MEEPVTHAHPHIVVGICLIIILVFYILLTLASDCLVILPSNQACAKAPLVGTLALKILGIL